MNSGSTILKTQFNFSSNTFTFSRNVLINSDFCNLMDTINNRDYHVVGRIITNLENNTKAFYSLDMKKELYILLKSFLVIRRYIQRNYKKNNQIICRINEMNLSLSDISSDKSIDITINNSIYSFDITELLKIYKYSLHNIGAQLYLDADIYPPRNPYTNIPFTLRENIIIYNKFKDYYISIGRSFPVYLEKFKNVYFDIEIYLRYNFESLMLKSITSYIEDLSEKEFKSEFKIMVASSIDTRDNYCRYCYKKYELVKLFSKTIGLYILNSNNIFIFGNYIREFHEVLEKKQLVFTREHRKKHRIFFWKTNVRRFNLITTSEPPLDSHVMAI